MELNYKDEESLNYYARINEIIDRNRGFLVTDEVTKADIPRVYISEMVKRGEIVKVERGIYLKKGIEDDELYRGQLKYKGIVYSHETALILNGVIDKKIDSTIMVTVKTGINPTRIKERGLKVFTIKEQFLDLGLITLKTPQGNEVRTYNIERSICDMVRSRNQVTDRLFARALKTYFKSDFYDDDKLMEMAKPLHVAKIIESYKKFVLL